MFSGNTFVLIIHPGQKSVFFSTVLEIELEAKAKEGRTKTNSIRLWRISLANGENLSWTCEKKGRGERGRTKEGALRRMKEEGVREPKRREKLAVEEMGGCRMSWRGWWFVIRWLG